MKTRLILLAILIAFLLTLSLIACQDDGDNDDDDDNDDNDDVVVPDFGDVTVEPASDGNPLARKIIVRTKDACRLSGIVTNQYEPGFGTSSPIISPEGTEHEFWFYGLIENRKFQYIFFRPDFNKALEAQGTFKTPVLPEIRPEPVELVVNEAPGITDWYMVYYSHKSDDVVLIMLYDRQGRIRMFHPSSNGQFPQVMPSGEIVTTLHNHLVGIRQNGEEYFWAEVKINKPVLRATHHKFYLENTTANSAVVIFARYGPGVQCDLFTPTDFAVGDGIAEIDGNGEEVWRWDIFDHLDQIPPQTVDPGMCELYWWGPDITDWTHGNAVVPYPGQNAYLVSYRNISRVVKINRESGELEWQMGPGLDFTWIGNEDERDKWFHFQHDPHWLSNDRMLLYDNNQPDASETYSRALELQVDLDAMTVKKVWEYRMPHHRSEGNVQRHENGNTLVCSGSDHRLVEMPLGGAPGQEYFKMVFPNGIMRAEYYPSLWRLGNPPVQPGS